MSIIRADSIKNRVGDGAPDFPNGITVTGVVTATTLNSVTNNVDVDDFISVGNNIQLGNAGVITATSGNFTGNVSIGGTLTYEDVTNIDSVGIVTARTGVITPNVDVDDFISVGSNIHLGNAGVVTATSFSGNGSALTGITQTTINNNANNRLITGSGTANTLEAESSFTYDGNGTINIEGTGAAAIQIKTPNSTDGGVYFRTGSSNPGAVSYLHSNNSMNFRVNSTNKLTINSDGDALPGSNNTQDLGSSSLRWANVYTQDLKLSNEAKKDEGGNDVDGTWGDYTIQEGESDLYLINNRNGKKYKFMLKEVN